MSTKIRRPIICILGGPGSGKGTQCDLIVDKYNLEHISTGDLIREKIKTETKSAVILSETVQEGKLVSNDEILKLLRANIDKNTNAIGFLIDGYPREKTQGVEFEKTVGPIDALIYLDAPEEVLVERLKKRALTSGRSDDNEETIRKRLITFTETVQDVLDMYGSRITYIDSNRAVEEVFQDIETCLDGIFSKKPTTPFCRCKEKSEKMKK